MAKPLLSYRAVAAALVSRLMDGDTLSEGRENYVGASEVGACPRLVTYRKALALPWTPDADAAGAMLPGKLAENEAIQLLRIMGLDRALSATGRSQVTLEDPDYPLKSHPDGLLAEDSFTLDPSSTYFRADGSRWEFESLLPFIVGPGIVEVKSGSLSVWKSVVKKGLSSTYLDQTMAEMGLSERRWTLVVYVCRENLNRIAFFFVPYDDAHFQGLRRRSAAMIGAAALGRGALFAAGLGADPEEQEGAIMDALKPHLLEADSDRGFCSNCPIRFSCPAMTRTMADGSFPPEVEEEVVALALCYDEARGAEAAAESDKNDARDRIVSLAEKFGASRAVLPPPYTSLSISKQNGRDSCDFARLKSKHPEAYADCVSQGDPFVSIRVNRKRGK